MEVHWYTRVEGFAPFRAGTAIPTQLAAYVNSVFDKAGEDCVIVLCPHGRTGVGSYVDPQFNQLSGWKFMQREF